MEANRKSIYKNNLYSDYVGLNIKADQIASAITPYDMKTNMDTAFQEMEHNDFDVICISDNAEIIGYIDRKCSTMKNSIKPFKIDELIASNTPLLDALSILCKKERVFVLDKNRVVSIITHADIQKIPIHLLVFELISQLENLLAQYIRIHYKNEDFLSVLKDKRIDKARILYASLESNNTEIA